jgi:hypothetical protein
LAGLVAYPFGQPIADAIATASLTQSGSVQGRINKRGLTILHLANFVGSESINAAMDSVDVWLDAAESIRSTVDMSDAERLRMLKALDGTGVLLIILYQRLRSGRGEAGLYRGHRELVRKLVAGDRPTVLLSLGSPYDVETIRGARSALIGYDQTIATARAAVSVLLGGTDPPGALPVASSNR